MFALKRPCDNCPFRIGKGSLFRLDRLPEILSAVSFQCHKTVDYSAGENEGRPHNTARDQQCAGLMALLHRTGRPNQMMQVAERLGVLDPAELDPRGEAYASLGDVFRAHLRGIEP